MTKKGINLKMVDDYSYHKHQQLLKDIENNILNQIDQNTNLKEFVDICRSEFYPELNQDHLSQGTLLIRLLKNF